MRQDTGHNDVVGLYIHIHDGGEMVICLVRRVGERVLLDAAEGDRAVASVFNHITASQLDAMVAAVTGRRVA